MLQPETEYLARLTLDSREVLIELFPESAPEAVNSFIFLAQQGWYDDNPIQRVIPGVLAETGDPTGTGLGGPGYFFQTEIDPSLHFDRAGVVAMSSVSPGTNGSQFFITLAPLPELNGSRTIFGHVVQGLNWIANLPARDPLTDLLSPAQATLLHVVIETR
ncbi:MAG: peptidylprolyl isomerase [Chloroflexota bacterium]